MTATVNGIYDDSLRSIRSSQTKEKIKQLAKIIDRILLIDLLINKQCPSAIILSSFIMSAFST